MRLLRQPRGCWDHLIVATNRHVAPASATPASPAASVQLRRWREVADLRRRSTGVLVSVALVAAVTGAIELLKPHVPVLSLAVLYLFAVLPVAVLWGLAYGIAISIGSMLAFNFFFLPPLYTLSLQDSRNWFALAVFVVTSVVVSELGARSRRQAREPEAPSSWTAPSAGRRAAPAAGRRRSARW